MEDGHSPPHPQGVTTNATAGRKQNMDKQTYMLNQLKVLTGIPSPTGMSYEISNYLMAELSRLGFTP